MLIDDWHYEVVDEPFKQFKVSAEQSDWPIACCIVRELAKL